MIRTEQGKRKSMRPQVRFCTAVDTNLRLFRNITGAAIAQWLERRTHSCLKGRGFESLQGRRENFLLHVRLSVLTLISVSVPPPYDRSST